MGLIAYFDESGTDSGNDYLVVAGFASSVEQWSRFDEEWRAVLDEYSVPYFHAKEFEKARHGFGRYAEWTASKREEFLRRLLGIITRRTFKSFATALEKKAFREIVDRHKDLREYCKSPFTFSVFNCIHAVTEWREHYHADETILFVFDDGHANKGELIDAAKRITLGRNDRMIQDIKPGDDQTLTPLQAADLLAFEFLAERRRHVQRPRQYSRYPTQVLDRHPSDWLTINADAIAGLVEKLVDEGSFEIIPAESLTESNPMLDDRRAADVGAVPVGDEATRASYCTEQVRASWPPEVDAALGAFPDFPDETELRSGYGSDVERERLDTRNS